MTNILIVEDPIEVQAVLSDYMLFTAKTLRPAWQYLDKNEVHLVILDVSLPDGDGFKFCAGLQLNPATRNRPYANTRAAGRFS